MMKLKLQYFVHLMRRPDSLENTLMLGKIEGRRRRGRQRMICLDGIIGSMDMSMSKLREMVQVREAWRAAVQGVAKNQTGLSDRTITTPEQSEHRVLTPGLPGNSPKAAVFWQLDITSEIYHRFRFAPSATGQNHIPRKGESSVTSGKFPCGPVVRTQCFHYRGPGFNPWSGN